MGFTNRWVCKSLEDYNFEDVKSILEDNKSGKRKGDKFELNYMINLDPQINSTEKSEYLSGTFYFEEELEEEGYEFSDNGDLNQIKEIRKKMRIVSFWLSDNGIFLFKNRSPASISGKDLLSEIIFKKVDNIKGLTFDIEFMEKDVLNGILQGMWLSSYRDRKGNIHSGINYGESIDKDVMFNQTVGAPRNQIGIELILEDEIVKIKITRKGSIMLFKDLDDPTDVIKHFEIIEDFSKYAILSK